MRTIDDFSFKEKRALIRVDFNVPLNGSFVIQDDSRMTGSLPTIKKILNDGGSVVLMSHLGRPKNGPENKFSLKHVNSAKVPFSKFMQGYIHANELMNYDSASVLYRDFIDLYPNHEMVESVKFELKYLGLGINEIPELKHLIE